MRLFFPALAALALVAAGCSYSGEGQIPCVDNSSCPSDYPVCGSAGKCVAGTAATSSVAITGVDGHAAADYLSGTVRVLVSARATSGVRSVTLASGSVNFPASTVPAASPLYAFDVNTTALTDGDATLTATLTAGDNSGATATGTLHVDNAKPVITSFTASGGPSTTITAGTTASLGVSFTPATAIATITDGTGVGSMTLTSSGSALVSPDTTTTFNLRVTSRSGVTVQSGTTGQPPDVTVSVVSPVSFTGNFTVTPNVIQQGPAGGNFTFSVSSLGSSVVSAVVKDAANATVGTFSGSPPTALVAIPATAPGTTQLSYTAVISNAASTPDTVSIPVVVTVSPVPAPTITKFEASTVHTSSGVSVNWTLNVTGSTTGTPSVDGVCSPPVTVAPINIPLASGIGSASSPAPTVGATSTCTYTVTVQNGTASAQANAVVTVEPLPTIGSFVFQTSLTPAATFAPGSNVILSHAYNAPGGTARINGVTAGASGSTTTFNNIQASTVYTLTVTNLAGATATSTATATVSAQVNSFSVGATLGTSSGTATITNGGTTTLFASFAGSGASGNAAAALSCAPSCNGTLTAPAIPSGGSVLVNGTTNGTLTYTLTVTPSSGTTATATVIVRVLPPANATSLTAAAPVIHVGEATTLTPVFDFGSSPAVAGTATVAGSDGSSYSNLISGTAITVAPGSTTIYTLSVVNGAGTAAATTPTATVTVSAAPGSWTGLNTATFDVRTGATVTALDNGKVLIAGGMDGTNPNPVPSQTARLCDATGACVSRTMGTPRAFHTAVKVGSGPNAGKVLLTGGYTAAGPATPTSSAEFYDPATDAFANTIAITTGAVTAVRARHIAVFFSTTTILIAGGTDGASNLNTAIKYNISTATPTTADVSNTMAQPRASFTGTLLASGSVLIVGGKTGTDVADRTAELFAPGTVNGTFSPTGFLPSGEDKRNHTAVMIGGASANAGKVLISGGVIGAAAGTPSTSQFLYSAGTFTAIAALGTTRSNHAAISLPTFMVLICGGTSTGTDTLSSCERYDPAPGTGIQVATTSMVEARKDFGLAPITISSIVEILAGGGTPATPSTFAETYNAN